MPTVSIFRLGGQAVALAACVAAASLYIVLLFFNPYSTEPARPYATPPFQWAGLNPVPVIMIGLQGAGIVATLGPHLRIMYVLFVCMFVPVGWYMLNLPSMYQWIGVSNLAYLAGTLMISASRQRKSGRNSA